MKVMSFRALKKGSGYLYQHDNQLYKRVMPTVQRSSCVVKVWLSILASLAFFTPALWCRVFPLPRFPPPAFLTLPRFPLLRFQSPHYFTEFVYDVVVKQLLGLPRFQNLLLIVYDHINTICAIIQRLFRQNKLW